MVQVDIDATFQSLGDDLLRKLASLNPRHPLLSQAQFSSYQARFLLLHDAVKEVEGLSAEMSPAEMNKEYHRTLRWFPNRSAALRIAAATLHECERHKGLSDTNATKAEAMRLRDIFSKTMAQGQYYEPFVCLIITCTLSALMGMGPGTVLLLVNLLLERRAPGYVYALFNWVFALPEAEQKRFWLGAISSVPALSPFELANGAAINAAAFPIMPNWPGLEEVNRALLGTAPLIGAGSNTSPASAPPPPNTFPASLFGSSFQVQIRAGPLLSTFLKAPLAGAGYAVPVTDGFVDLTAVESHFAALKAEVESIKAKLESTQKEKDALNRKVNDLQSRLSRAGADLSGKNKGKLGLRGGGIEGEANTPI